MSSQLSPSEVARQLVKPYRELTVAAVVLGIIQGVILNIAFVYVALKIGLGIGGSTVAAIMGYALLTGLLKRGTSVENNINQTIASGINVSGSGVVFTLPALFLLNAAWTSLPISGPGVSEESMTPVSHAVSSGAVAATGHGVLAVPVTTAFDANWRVDPSRRLNLSPAPILLGGIAGALLGTVLIIPLRKQMIEMDRLRFPSGIAVTTIIRSGKAGIEKAKLLALGMGISTLWKIILLTGVLEFTGVVEGEDLSYGLGLVPLYYSPVITLSLMIFAAGMLTGKGGLPVVLGGILAWWVIAPAAVNSGWTPDQFPLTASERQELAEQAANEGIPLEELLTERHESRTTAYLYFNMLRPVGIGVLIGGALMGVVIAFPAIVSAFRSLAMAAKTAGAREGVGGSEEMPLRFILTATFFGVLLFFAATMLSGGVGVAQAAGGTVLATLWLAVAGLIVAQATGMTDMSPISGMALISVTLMLGLFSGNVVAAMVVGVAVCVAIGQAADMMQDLKTGHMIGAKPIKQQIVQFAFPWIGAVIAIGAVYVLWQSGTGGAGGFGNKELPAPQGTALKSVIEGVLSGNVPTDKYLMGGLIGALLGAAPLMGLGVLVGLSIYLPFAMTLAYGVGCVIHIAFRRWKGADFCAHKLVPFSAGLIVGEALTSVGYATVVIVSSTLR